MASKKLGNCGYQWAREALCPRNGARVVEHDGIECTASLSIGLLLIRPGTVVAMDLGPQCKIANGNIGANTISRVALGGQFGNSIGLVVLHKINMTRCPSKLQVMLCVCVCVCVVVVVVEFLKCTLVQRGAFQQL